MYFKKLEIFGFKSFADKTVLNFEPGITAVVGPNGCGKSNIFDSIRWVLGEQSVKQLRGSSMEDVIFNGTEKKAPLGFAEVSVTFSNESRMLPVEYDEVTVTRRLFRSGESEYRLNKTKVRLKDIQELLMGTGIGAEAYSLVQQGKVDLVVSAKPEDRRIILDEASGITKYKAKKKEALNKLKGADENLLRVNDIITEVKRQIASIDRQANKARKYKEEFDKLKAIDLKLAGFKLGQFEGQRSALRQAMTDLENKEQELRAHLEESSNILTHEADNLEDLEQKISDIRGEEIKLAGQIDLHKRQVEFNAERIQNLEESKVKLDQQKADLIERCRVQQIKVEELKQGLIGIEDEIKNMSVVFGEKKEDLVSLEKTLDEAHSRIKEYEEKILGLTSKQMSIRNVLTEIMKEVQGALARERRLEQEKEKVLAEKVEIEQKLQNTDYQINTVQGSISDLSDEKEMKTQTLRGLKSNLSRLENAIDDFEKRRLFLMSQKEFIEKMNVQYQDIPDPIVDGVFITDVPPSDHHTGLIGKVKDVRRVLNNEGTFLGMGQERYEITCETKFIELDPQQIKNKIEEMGQEIERLTGEKNDFISQIQDQTNIFEELDKDIQDKEKILSVLEAQKKDIIEEKKKIQGELELVDSESREVIQTLGAAKQKETESNFEMDSINQELEWCQNDIKERQSWIATKSQEKEQISIEVAQTEKTIESANDRLNNQHSNIAMLTEALDRELEEIKIIDDDVSQFGAKRVQFEEETMALNQSIENIQADIKTIRNNLEEHEEQKADITGRLSGIRSDIQGVESELNGMSRARHDHEMREQKLTYDRKAMQERLEQTYKIDLDDFVRQLAEKDSAEDEAEPLNIPELEAESERLRKRCNSFGNVNLAAVEESEELRERFEFLTKQQSDLIEAKSQLMNTISKINRSTKQMFMETFEKVSEEFRTYFRMLFGGGDGQLVLMDPENVLESGIDIVARPPGKKLQNISLMSGGEKTLTAIALIFGVFKVNPSPFCILDEIDAALDESNVGRFANLLHDFAKIAQFIVITHNKKTIGSADIMYGITMPETGMSRIVSVKFHDEKQKQAAIDEAVPVPA